MRHVLWLLLTLVAAPGCGDEEIPKEKYFSGQPVEHWLDAIRSADPKERRKAADVLGNVGPIDPRAVPALIDAVKDRDAKVRDAAVLGLSKIGTPASAADSALEAATRDRNATVRDHARAALQRIRGEI